MDNAEVELLHNRLREVSSQISGVASTTARMHDNLRSQISELTDAQQELESAVEGIRQDLSEFIERNAREMSTLIALSKLLNVRAELDREFAQYRAVRRNARGLLRAMDNDLAEDATTTLIAETMTIDVPDYWLASMINAAAAWLRDDPGGARRALRSAIELDRGKSALYAALLNARYRRLPATGEWLTLYLKQLDPLALPADFVVVLDAAVVGALGVRTREKVGNWCMNRFETLRAEPGLAKAQVKRWLATLAGYANMPGPEPAFAADFPVLERISAQSSVLAHHYRRSQSFAFMLEALRDHKPMLDVGAQSWKDMIDGLLDNLTGLAEPRERTLRRQEQDYQRIVDRGGDEELAGEDRMAEAPLEQPTVDLLTMLTNVAQRPDQFPVSGKTVQLAQYLSVKPVVLAVREQQNEGRGQAAEPVAVTIANWSGMLRPGPPDEELVAQLSTSLDRLTARDELRERRMPTLVGAAMVTVAGLLAYGTIVFTGGRATSLFALIPFLLACAAAITFVVIRTQTPQRQYDAQERGKRRKEEGLVTLRDATAERNRLYQQWTRRLDAGDALVEYVRAIGQPHLTPDPESLEREAEAARSDLVTRPGGQMPRLPAWNLSLSSK